MRTIIVLQCFCKNEGKSISITTSAAATTTTTTSGAAAAAAATTCSHQVRNRKYSRSHNFQKLSRTMAIYTIGQRK